MKTNKFIMILFLLLFSFSLSVFSYTTLNEWANGQFSSSGCSGYLASSCFPQYDLSLNFSLITISDTSSYLPVVFYNLMDTNNPEFDKRYFYLVSGNDVNIYDTSDGGYYSSYSNSIFTTGSISCRPFFKRNLMNNGYDMVTVQNISNLNSIISVSGMNTDKSFYSNQYKIINGSIKDCDMNFLSNDNYLSILLSNGTVETYQINESTIEIKNSISVVPPTVNYTYPVYSDSIVMYDMNNDNHDDLIYAVPYSYSDANYRYGYIRYGIYDVYNKNNILSVQNVLEDQRAVASYGEDSYTSVNLALVKTGLSSSNYKIYIKAHHYYLSSGQYYQITSNYVFNTAGDILFQPNDFTANGNKTQSNIVFTDFNYDGFIEPCLLNFNALKCYNSAFVNLVTVSNYITNSDFISMAKYTNSTYMAVIAKDSIYEFNSSEAWKIYNLSYNKFDYEMPLSLIAKGNYSNDLFAVYKTFIDMYQLKSNVVVCGDNVCSQFETALICPEDCFIGTAVNTTKLNPTVPCVNNSQCLSGQCIDYRCSYLSVNQVCSVDTQCLSTACTNGKCEQSSLSQNLNQAKNEWFGYDDMTANIIALCITLVMTLVIVVVVVMISGSGVISGVSGFIVFASNLVFWTFFGWLNPFILFSIVILIVGLAMLYIFMKSQGGK
jgi:hypothetical protein